MRRLAALLAVGMVVPLAWLQSSSVVAQGSSRLFPETGKTVQGKFLAYWDAHGGLAQQGFPISGEMQEKSDTDGKVYIVQYFERAVFESHSENAAPNDVLLSLLGNFLYKQKYPGGAPGQQPNNSTGSALFKETGKRAGGVFLQYWKAHGGLAQQGLPISEEFQERSDLNGKTYTVQYFERAVFESHPENQSPYDVLLSQLGTFRYRAKYSQAAATATPALPTATARPAPTSPVSTSTPTAVPAPTSTPSGSVQEVRLALREWSIVPSRVEVAAGRIRFTVTNEGAMAHNLKISTAQGAIIAGTRDFLPSEGPQTFEVELQPGTYSTLCSLPGHANAGQLGTLIVR